MSDICDARGWLSEILSNFEQCWAVLGNFGRVRMIYERLFTNDYCWIADDSGDLK